jgi:hypothetical protein
VSIFSHILNKNIFLIFYFFGNININFCRTKTLYWLLTSGLLIGFQLEPHAIAQQASRPIEGAQTTVSTQIVHLYFISEDGRHLEAEAVEIASGQPPLALGRDILQALFQGPKTSLRPIFVKTVTLRSFFMDEAGIAFVDLPAMASEAQPGGVTAEHLTLYAIVNSLTLNVPEVTAVKVLIAGREAETFSGHIDISYPLTTNLLMIR